jgi:hypothetical protein
MLKPSTEKFTVTCPKCDKSMTVTYAHVGKKGRCPQCLNVFPIEAPLRSPAEDLTPGLLDLQPIGPSPDQGDPFANLGVAGGGPAIAAQEWPDAEPQLKQEDGANAAATLANDYLTRARNDKGSTMQQVEDEDLTYRFWTSWGSVIGGITTVCISLFLLLLSLLLWFAWGMVFSVFMLLGGIAWIVQGMNYVTYYNWKDRGSPR